MFPDVIDVHTYHVIEIRRKGCCWDNANMESFYHTLKTEMVYFEKFKRLEEAMAYIMDYIRFYNQDRLHSSLNYQSPNEVELKVA